ncbi:MAG: aldo/keto reductase [Planctomycetes bacterium]|nr:aldo/keto reductase [Planctomycetota bacterium]MCB9824243.1 aldo/keto reductase [Planctomycetota bacterium]MCB9828474.1 aldo/keto reductase [Planctomycetota bacterium]MCB9900241.1 aldo/keto reductase [Planctomycetota bacterium]
MPLTTLSGQPSSRLALGAHPQTPGACVDVALAGGIHSFFFYDRHAAAVLEALATALPSRRDDTLLITGTEERDIKGVQNDLDAIRKRLGVDTVDAFLLLYVAPGEDIGDVDRLLDHLHEQREAGALRYVGASAHDRKQAERLARDPRVDVQMHRYNMAHRGAEKAVFPAALESDTPVIAFTCTRWGTLLAGHEEWEGPAPSAPDCYRFALAHPAVELALTAPHSVGELQQNLAVLDAPAPTPDEMAAWRAYGDIVYGGVPGEFETSWP